MIIKRNGYDILEDILKDCGILADNLKKDYETYPYKNELTIKVEKYENELREFVKDKKNVRFLQSIKEQFGFNHTFSILLFYEAFQS